MTITSHIDIFAEILNSSFFTMKQSEIKKKYPYVERDISWMYFNQRILLEAARPEVPLLERLTFLGIYSNNLDEFFRVRVATLNRIVEYADKNIQAEQETAACTLKQIGKLHNRYYKQFEEIFASIMEELKKGTSKIKNPHSYLISMLYNAQNTQNVHYQSAVNSDMRNIGSKIYD